MLPNQITRRVCMISPPTNHVKFNWIENTICVCTLHIYLTLWPILFYTYYVGILNLRHIFYSTIKLADQGNNGS